jgi:azurin
MHHTARIAVLAVGLAAGTSPCAAADGAPPAVPALRHLGTHETALFDRSASEVAAFHAPSRRLWVVNGAAGVDVLDISDPARPAKVASHPAKNPTSVAIHGDLVAIATPGEGGAPGTIAFRAAGDGRELGSVTVGHGPDMCTFTPDGGALVVANEGEPSDTADEDGSVSIVDLRAGLAAATVRTAGFGGFEDRRAALVAQGVHLPVPGATVARQLEPEYVAISPDGRFAFVAIQEANALAVVDLAEARVAELHGLGLKDFAACGLDPSDRDGVRIRPEPILGLRQPDTVVCWTDGGRTLLAISEEGEMREDEATKEVRRVADLELDPARFPDAAIKGEDRLGRLEVSAPACDADGDGKAERIVAFGGRGVSIWEWSPGSLREAWNSGSQVERAVAARGTGHNNDGRRFRSEDRRSNSKGPEPEGLATAVVDGRRLLAAGLERPGGVMLWDATDPASPRELGCFGRFDPSVDPATDLARAGDIAPEGLVIIPADAAPGGKALLVTCNEVSGTTSVWAIEPGPPTAVTAPVRTVALKAVPGAMQYDLKEIRAKPGEELEITLENGDTMQHNLLIVAPGKMAEVGVAADRMGETPEGKACQFVPRSPAVLAVMGLVDPGKTGTLRFTVPDKPGTYNYVCTYPGHWRMMNGKLRVAP